MFLDDDANRPFRNSDQYLSADSQPRYATPRVLVVCDVSAPLGRGAGGATTRPWVWQAASRALDIVYAARQYELLGRYLGTGDLPESPPGLMSEGDVKRMIETASGGIRANRLWAFRGREPVKVIYLSPARLLARGSEQEAAIAHVTGLSTLAELSRHSVDLAFWVGTKLGVEALPAVCQALGLDDCPKVVMPPVPQTP